MFVFQQKKWDWPSGPISETVIDTAKVTINLCKKTVQFIYSVKVTSWL